MVMGTMPTDTVRVWKLNYMILPNKTTLPASKLHYSAVAKASKYNLYFKCLKIKKWLRWKNKIFLEKGKDASTS